MVDANPDGCLTSGCAFWTSRLKPGGTLATSSAYADGAVSRW